ncbi:MAG: hypothetical protein Q8S19_06395 [Bacillota bacterium]|nr:hypothetical protein [Bacillota bacterium]
MAVTLVLAIQITAPVVPGVTVADPSTVVLPVTCQIGHRLSRGTKETLAINVLAIPATTRKGQVASAADRNTVARVAVVCQTGHKLVKDTKETLAIKDLVIPITIRKVQATTLVDRSMAAVAYRLGLMQVKVTAAKTTVLATPITTPVIPAAVTCQAGLKLVKGTKETLVTKDRAIPTTTPKLAVALAALSSVVTRTSMVLVTLTITTIPQAPARGSHNLQGWLTWRKPAFFW